MAGAAKVLAAAAPPVASPTLLMNALRSMYFLQFHCRRPSLPRRRHTAQTHQKSIRTQHAAQSFAALPPPDGWSLSREAPPCIVEDRPREPGIWRRCDMDGTATSLDETGEDKSPGIPFDNAKLDGLLEEAGIDVLVVTSKHNIQYLLGGYRFFFFDAMDAIGVSRYLPIFVYPKGRPQDAAYIGNPMESYERDLGKFWVPSVQPKTWG